MSLVIEDLAPGLWIWRQPHPSWSDGGGWDPLVTSVGVTSQGVSLVLDPLAPAPRERAFWERMDAHAPTVVAPPSPVHLRAVRVSPRWYGARAYGPLLFWGGDAPDVELIPLRPGTEL